MEKGFKKKIQPKLYIHKKKYLTKYLYTINFMFAFLMYDFLFVKINFSLEIYGFLSFFPYIRNNIEKKTIIYFPHLYLFSFSLIIYIVPFMPCVCIKIIHIINNNYGFWFESNISDSNNQYQPTNQPINN